LAHEPGIVFNYLEGYANPFHLLSRILTEVTGESAAELAKKQLFAPLGISRFTWLTEMPLRVSNGWSGLRMTARDMAKIGLLFLNRGRWNDKGIVSEQWVAEATKE